MTTLFLLTIGVLAIGLITIKSKALSNVFFDTLIAIEEKVNKNK